MIRRNLFVAVMMLALVGAASFTSLTTADDAGVRVSTANVRSNPPDTTEYARPKVSSELAAGARGITSPGFFVIDVNSIDFVNGSEPGIAIDSTNPNNIVIHGGFGGWNGNAPYYVSTDGGLTWTRVNSIPPPPGAAATLGCPCDTTLDYGLDANLYGAFLTSTGAGTLTNVFSASNTNPLLNLFSYFLVGGNAQLTNQFAGSLNGADQPWLMTNRDTATASQTNTYVAYDDFNAGPPVTTRVSTALGSSPPDFAGAGSNDLITGNSGGGGINPGHRLAVDTRTGFIYSLYQNCTAGCGGSPKTIAYMLNRSTDNGATWTLNGSGTGIAIATVLSVQPTPKFGTVNALLGGIDHAAVDPTTGDVYVVYGANAGGADNEIFIRHVTFDGSGNAVVGGPVRVSPAGVDAALPSVAVAPNATVGVLYDTFDGFSSDGFPIFTAHFAFSTDHAATFTDQTLLTFLSPAKDDSNARQRVLGDYQQLKTVNGTQAGATFYGVFTGSGVPLGRSQANNDPIFFKVTLAPQININTNPVAFGDVCREDPPKQAQLEVANTGAENLVISSITRTSGSTDISFVTGPSFPVSISPDAHFDFALQCDTTTIGAKSATFTIVSNDPASPSTLVNATCNAGAGTIVVTGSGDFGAAVCGGSAPTQTLKINNVGTCNLNVASAVVSCADFTKVNNPFPVAISHDSSLDLGIKFTPTSAGPKSCNVTINSDDPGNPAVVVPLNGDTPTGNASLSVPAGLTFPPTVIQQTAACNSTLGVPVANTGKCDVKVTNVALSGANVADYSLTGLSGLPLTIAPGGQLGTGDLNAVFAPLAIGRTRTASVDVTFENDPITHATAVKSVPLCGESVDRGVRVLVTQGGVPVPVVRRIKLQKAIAPGQEAPIFLKNKQKNIPLTSVVGAPPCASFQFHTEYGGASDPTQLKAGTYRLKVKIAGFKTKTVRFNVGTCSFTPLIVVDF